MIILKEYIRKHIIKSEKNIIMHNIFEYWCKYIKDHISYKLNFFGRISSFDVEAVKKMVKKDNFNRYSLLKHGLPVLFEFKGRRNYREYNEFTHTYGGYFLTDNYNNISTGFEHDFEGLPSNFVDTISFKTNKSESAITCKDRIEHKERMTLRILRFFLKQGCTPNNEIFIKNLIFKHNYHCKTFFIKILEMCYKYGLDENILLNILRTKNHFRFHSTNIFYYISPVLDIHKNRLVINDTIDFCIGWATKKSFLYTIINNGKGNLDILNDDVIGVITSFIYFI